MIEEQIRQLDDASALRMLSVIAEAHRDQMQETTPSRELAGALNEAMGGQCEATNDPRDGEAARLALAMLAQDERFAGPIETTLKGPTPQRMALGVVEGTLLATGILLALQTYFKFERKENGHWSVKIEKKSTSNSLVAPLVKKLMSVVGL